MCCAKEYLLGTEEEDPGQYGSVGWALAHAPKGCWLKSLSEHKPGLQAPFLLDGMQKAAYPIDVSISLFTSSFPLSKINNIL